MLTLFLDRYTDPETGWATVHWDDVARTRRRKASVSDGSIMPSPVYVPPLAPFESALGRSPAGYTIRCGWHPQFIEDLQRDPQSEPELFDGVTVIISHLNLEP